MSDTRLLWPLLAIFVLSASTLIRLFSARVASVRRGEVDPSYFLTYEGDTRESPAVVQLSRHFSNLFEAPTLFHPPCLVAMAAGITTAPIVGLAWIYVALRFAHTVIHTGSNALRPRIAAYLGSWIALTLLWAAIVLEVLGAR